MFLLAIGIDTYESKDIKDLRGAVADARAFAAYFENHLGVPQDHITILENESATRAAILEKFRNLADDLRIQRGDPIVIYYAGHGSEAAAPLGWEAGGRNANIQLTMPYDVFCQLGGKFVDPIPDRTLGALLDAISQNKGNNIIVIMDSCFSASGTRSFSDSPNVVRSVELHPDFKLQEGLDQEMQPLFSRNGGLQSHILLSACSSSGPAWESNGRGVFTVALLELLNNSKIDKLRYRDIVMRMEIPSDFGQSPHCEGLNLDRLIFTTTSLSTEYFIPVYTRTPNSEFAVILNGGAAHGLRVGDEFAIYPDMDCPKPNGSLVVDELGPFYSIMRPADPGFPLGNNAVATRSRQGQPRPVRIFSRSEDVSKILFPMQDLSQLIVTHTAEECDIFISVEGDQTIVRLGNMGNAQGFRIEPTASDLARIFKASWQFFSELDRIADFPDITQCVQVHIHELTMSSFRFPGAPTAELHASEAASFASDSYALRQGSYYGLKLTNNSRHDLYPLVQYFDPSNEFRYYTLYHPPCSRSNLDVPLVRAGGSLTIGYGSGGSPPFLIPCSDSEGLGFLKISLFSRPLDPFCDAQSFRSARRLPDNLKGPWATITKKVTHRPPQTQGPPADFQRQITEFLICTPTRPIVKPSRSCVVYDAHDKGVDRATPLPFGERPARSRLAIFWDGVVMRLKLGFQG